MNLTQIAQLMPHYYDENVAPWLTSKPGTGKSMLIEEVIPEVMCKHLGIEEFGIKILTLTACDAPDLQGFCIPTKRESDGKMITRFTEPSWMPSDTDPEHGILFLDEASQGSHDVLKTAASLILDGRVGEWKLPSGWRVVLAGNRMADKAGVVKPLSHVTNRVCYIDVDFHIDSWVNWAYTQGLDSLFIAFASFRPAVISEEVPVEPRPFCTPRAFARFAKFAQSYARGHLNESLAKDTVLMEVAIGMLGKGAATECLSFLRVAADLPSYAEVLADPKAAAKSIPKGRLDVTHAASCMVVARCEDEHIPAVFEFVTTMPKEFQVSTLRNLLERVGPQALQVPAFAKFVQENSALISASFSA
jgi:hypothetical protein